MTSSSHDLQPAHDEHGHNASPQLPEGVKNYLIDIDGTITEDVPNEEPERMATCAPFEDALETLNKGSDFEGIVIGRPHLIGGGTTDSTPHIDDVADKIRKAWPGMAIHFVDESFTSQEASSIQIQGGMKKSKRREKGSLDAIAASLILQRHLDAQAYNR